MYNILNIIYIIIFIQYIPIFTIDAFYAFHFVNSSYTIPLIPDFSFSMQVILNPIIKKDSVVHFIIYTLLRAQYSYNYHSRSFLLTLLNIRHKVKRQTNIDGEGKNK